MARHLTTIHQNEPHVAHIIAKKESDPEIYKLGLKKLKCFGNFMHNVKTLKQNKNDIVVVKRPTRSRKVSEYLPCVHCYGFYVQDELWRHTRNCDLKRHEDSSNLDICSHSKKLLMTSNGVIQNSRLLLDTACIQEDSALSDEMRALVSAMHQDDLSEVVRKDILLNQFGQALLMKYGPRKKNDIGQRLRQLARLLLQIRKNNSDSSLQYMDLLCGKNFDKCLSGTEELCKLNITDDGRREFQIPSLALRLGHLLKKISTIKQGYCLRNDLIDDLKHAENFGQLLQAEWTDSIASNALNTLRRRKDQTIEVLPLTDDLRQLREYQMKMMKQCISQIKELPLFSTWRKLAQLTMARMIIFNKRRGGEVSRLLLQTYNTRPNWKQSTNQEVLSSLQPLEQKLVDRVDLVQIPGKKNRKVPMLITEDVKEAMDILNAYRDKVGISSSNPYFFASRSAGYLDSWQAMSSITKEASLKQPELVTSTKLRKYNATVSQLFDLNHGELEWLSNHMGHDLNIHKDFYRLHDSTIEIAKVSRLLMAIDTGNASKFVGKQLDEITLDDFCYDNSIYDNIDKSVGTERFARSDTNNTHTKAVHASDDDKHLQNSKQVHEDEGNSDTLLKANHELNKLNGHARKNKPAQEDRVKRSRSHASTSLPVHDSDDVNLMKENEDKRNSETLSEDNDELHYKRHSRKRKHTTTWNRITSDSEVEDDTVTSTQNNIKINLKSSWSSQEIQSLRNCFAGKINEGIFPSGNLIKLAISQNKCLQGRTVVNVRAKIQHLIKKNRNLK